MLELSIEKTVSFLPSPVFPGEGILLASRPADILGIVIHLSFVRDTPRA